MVVWIIGNIKINYKFHAKEITIQHIETGWCSGCADKGSTVTSLNCPDTVLRSSSYDLRAKNLSLLLIVFLLECNVISLQAELMKHTHITKIGIFLFVLCILSKLSTKDIVLKKSFYRARERISQLPQRFYYTITKMPRRTKQYSRNPVILDDSRSIANSCAWFMLILMLGYTLWLLTAFQFTQRRALPCTAAPCLYSNENLNYLSLFILQEFTRPRSHFLCRLRINACKHDFRAVLFQPWGTAIDSSQKCCATNRIHLSIDSR